MKAFLWRFFKDNRRKRILLIAVILAALFVWWQSLIPTDGSASSSSWITENIVNPILGLFGVKASHALVRKLAHVFEFFVLSIFTSLLLDCRPVRCFYAGFTIAFLDETIQVLTKRGPMITDVWIDMIGITAGFIVAWLISLCEKRKKLHDAESGTAEIQKTI